MNKYETKRAEAINRIKNSEDYCGKNGKIFEIECARHLSRKNNVAGVGEVDVFVKVLVNGKATYKKAECKTNGGRVDTLLNGTNKSEFVIYRLDFTQKNPKSIDHRVIPPVIIPTNLFVNMLVEVNAIKTVSHNGEVDGIAIQPSSKKMFNRLNEYIENYGEAVLFDNEKTYEDWDFEGLEL